MKPMLEIKNLHAKIEGKDILKGINLSVNAGEVHAIMGPNASGKSTLSHVLSGRESYEVTEGEVFYEGRNLLELSPDERAREGVFLAFQYPVEIPGVNNAYFLKAAINSSASFWLVGRPFLSRTASRIQRIASDCCRLRLTCIGT